MADNKGKIIAGIVISAATIALAYFGFIYKLEDGLTAWQQLTKKKPKDESKKDDAIAGTSTITPSGGGASTSTGALPSGDFPIKKEDKNALVTRLQKALKGVWKQIDIGKVDGDFGNKTLTALKATGYGESVKDAATLANIELGVKPVAATASSSYGTLTVGKLAYATITGKATAYDLSAGKDSTLDIQKGYSVGTVKRLVGDSVQVDILGKQWSLNKKFLSPI